MKADKTNRNKARETGGRSHKSVKKQFYKAYESNKLDVAGSIVRKNTRKLVEQKGLDGAYKALRSQDATATAIQIIFLALFIWFCVWIAA